MFCKRGFGLFAFLCLCAVIDAANIDSSRIVQSYRPDSAEASEEEAPKPEKVKDDVVVDAAPAEPKKFSDKYVKSEPVREKSVVIDQDLNPALEGASNVLRNVLG